LFFSLFFHSFLLFLARGRGVDQQAIDNVGSKVNEVGQGAEAVVEDGQDVAEARKQVHAVVEPLNKILKNKKEIKKFGR
jgi:hypothetical protein